MVYAGTGKGLCALKPGRANNSGEMKVGDKEKDYEYADFGEWFADWFRTVECTLWQ